MVLGALGCGVFANSPEAVDLDESKMSKVATSKDGNKGQANMKTCKIRHKHRRFFLNFVHGISEGHCGGMAKAPTTRFGFSSDT